MVFGWGSSSSSSTSSSSAKSDDPPPAPNREQRQACWDARDAYFGCLRKAGVSIPGKEGDACKRENVEYEKNCASAWVDYFNKRKVLELRQQASLTPQFSAPKK